MKHKNKNVTETEFRALAALWGSPDDIPIENLSEKQAAVLFSEDRFFDNINDLDDAVELFKNWNLFEE